MRGNLLRMTTPYDNRSPLPAPDRLLAQLSSAAAASRSASALARPPAPPLVLRTPVDLLALVPYTFGFEPSDSLVLVNLDETGRQFQARADLPAHRSELGPLVQQLAKAAWRNGATRAALLVYTDDEREAERVAAVVCGAMNGVSARVFLALRTDGERWWTLAGRGPETPVEGEPYDLRCHPLTSQAVLEGRVTAQSREDLAASLVCVDPSGADVLMDALDELPELADRDEEAEARWLRGRIDDLVSADIGAGWADLEVAERARWLRALRRIPVRDAVWCRMDRAGAAAQVQLWRDVVRHCPAEAIAPPATLLAFAAWMEGNGALAWCALDRAREADPDYSLASLVAEALERAVPPDVWVPFGR